MTIREDNYQPFVESLKDYHIDHDWDKELINYFVYGLPPGSFHKACLCNDLSHAVMHSHILNQWSAICAFMTWIYHNAPNGSWGNFEAVDNWLTLSEEDRLNILHELGLYLTDEEVVWNKVKKV